MGYKPNMLPMLAFIELKMYDWEKSGSTGPNFVCCYGVLNIIFNPKVN